MAKVTDRAAVERYVQMVAAGKSHVAAYQATHPNAKSRGKALAQAAHKFHGLPEVQARMNAVIRETGERWSGFRDELLGYLTDEIRRCYSDNATLSPVMKQVEQASKILGLDRQTVEVKASLGCMDADAVDEKVNFLIAAAGRVAK